MDKCKSYLRHDRDILFFKIHGKTRNRSRDFMISNLKTSQLDPKIYLIIMIIIVVVIIIVLVIFYWRVDCKHVLECDKERVVEERYILAVNLMGEWLGRSGRAVLYSLPAEIIDHISSNRYLLTYNFHVNLLLISHDIWLLGVKDRIRWKKVLVVVSDTGTCVAGLP